MGDVRAFAGFDCVAAAGGAWSTGNIGTFIACAAGKRAVLRQTVAGRANLASSLPCDPSRTTRGKGAVEKQAGGKAQDFACY